MTAMTEAVDAGVRCEIDGVVGRIVLDRPKTLNALTLAMVERIEQALVEWEHAGLRAVTIESSDERAFCAGGDVRQIRQNTLDGDGDASDRFFATEYRVNAMLGSYATPVISLIDGICMGGGLGLSVHGPFRVVTERASFAMPETAIGFFPDVGGSYFLPRLPGAVGMYLGLIGTRIGHTDAVEMGLATHSCASTEIGTLPRLLNERSAEPVDVILRRLTRPPDRESVLQPVRALIDEYFGAPRVVDITQRLRAASDDDRAADDRVRWALATLDVLARLSPQSLEITFELLTWGLQRTLAECLAAERAAAHEVVCTPDFVEGVRAVLVDKDRDPHWSASRFLGSTAQGELLWSSPNQLGPPTARTL